MRVVQLYRHIVGERFPVAFGISESPHQIGERTCDKKILLQEAQTLTHARRVVWV